MTTKGQAHKPGMLCLVASKRPTGERNNGKTVTLVGVLREGQRWTCGCGQTGMILPYWDTAWEVTGELVCGIDVAVTRAAFMQSELIPLGDESLVKGEKWEHSNPLEDKIERSLADLAKTIKQIERTKETTK